MSTRTDWKLIIKYLSGECNDDELTAVERWMASHNRNKKFVDLLASVWNEPKQSVSDINVKRMWDELAVKANIEQYDKHKYISPNKVRLKEKFQSIFIPRIPILRYVVIIMIIALPIFLSPVGIDLLNLSGKKELTVVDAPAGEKSEVLLNDGSKITLAPGSHVEFPNEFTNNERDVTLKGEGYFEVAHDPDRPFIVHAKNADVQVLGTKFNVRAWDIESNTEVAVSDGCVTLSSKDSKSKRVVITKGKSSRIDAEGNLSEPVNTELNKVLGWIDNEYFFTDTPLKEILFHIHLYFLMILLQAQ